MEISCTYSIISKHLVILFEVSNFSCTCILVAQISLPNETMYFIDLGVFILLKIIYTKSMYNTMVNGPNAERYLELILSSENICPISELKVLFPQYLSLS